MSPTDKGLFNFAKLNNSNYSAWALRMQMVLMKESCYDTIKSLKSTIEGELVKKDEKAWNYIVLAVDDCQHVHVKSTTGGREAWEKLREFHVQTTLSNRIRIMKRLFRIRLDVGGDMAEHLQKIFEFFGELNAVTAKGAVVAK